MTYNIKDITVIIPSRNNLEYLKLAYKSLIDNYKNINIMILSDASTDGTNEWLEEKKKENNNLSVVIHNPKDPNDRKGIVGMFDLGIKQSNTKLILASHADIVYGKQTIHNMLKYIKEKTVVSATRIEPPLHVVNKEKIIHNLGMTYNQFDFDTFYEYEEKTITKYKSKITDGIFAPWLMFKQEFLDIGGHDELFAPQSKEDSDLFQRLLINKFDFIQPWNALVYHFTSRGSRFANDNLTNSDEWKKTDEKSTANFIRKWGTVPITTKQLKPVIFPIYNKIIYLDDKINFQTLRLFEPYGSIIMLLYNEKMIQLKNEYIEKYQKDTLFDLDYKIMFYDRDRIKEEQDIVKKEYIKKYKKNIDIILTINTEQFLKYQKENIQYLMYINLNIYRIKEHFKNNNIESNIAEYGNGSFFIEFLNL